MEGEERRGEPTGLAADSVPRLHQFAVAVCENNESAFVGKGIVAALLSSLSSPPCCRRRSRVVALLPSPLSPRHSRFVVACVSAHPAMTASLSFLWARGAPLSPRRCRCR